jgi:hypothetical protein
MGVSMGNDSTFANCWLNPNTPNNYHTLIQIKYNEKTDPHGCGCSEPSSM